MAVEGPWHIDIYPWTWAAYTGATPTRVQDGTMFNAGYVSNTGVLNDSIAWDVPLTAGTWTLTVVGSPYLDRGITTVKLDATTVGTTDWYSSGFLAFFTLTLSGIVVTSTGIKRLSLNMLTKNASSSGYRYVLQHLVLSRTA